MPEASPPEEIVLETYGSRIEAELAAATLRHAGLSVRVSSDDAGGMEPNLALVRGVRLLVRAGDADRARRLLEGPTDDGGG